MSCRSRTARFTLLSGFEHHLKGTAKAINGRVDFGDQSTLGDPLQLNSQCIGLLDGDHRTRKILKAHAFIAGFGLPLPVFALTGLMLLKPEPMIVVLIRTAPEVG